ncbi:MAG TPA: FecR domain-containing protein [Polyangiaceae bacterium]
MSSPREDALRKLVAEVRSQGTPELDLDRLETRLMSQLSTQKPASRTPTPWLAWAGVAVAAAAAYGVFTHVSPRAGESKAELRESRPLPRPAANEPLNGDALALAVLVSSSEEPRSVEHAGRARWTLARHSSAAIAEQGAHLTVKLESGSLSARVTPSQTPETFAVEVGGMRFAVHGTAFRVERTGDRVVLEVSEGIVAVEPRDVRNSAEFLLRASSRGEFALDGRIGKLEGNASVVANAAGPTSQHAVIHAAYPPIQAKKADPVTSAEPAPAPAPSANEPAVLPAQLSIGDVEAGVSPAVAIVERCFRSEGENGVAVTMKTGMTLRVTGQGEIDNVMFGPPLTPTVEACAAQGLRSVTFAHSLEGTTFTRILELSR